MKYEFYDIDSFGNEQNLVDNDYRKLIEVCIKYSRTFSFQIHSVYKNRVVVPDNILKKQFKITHSSYTDAKVVHVFLDNDVCQWILSATDNIWSWVNHEEKALPEDLTFYREDGSVFFSSVTHEGECTLHPREGEDVSVIISKGNWREMRDNETRFFPKKTEQKTGKRQGTLLKTGDSSVS